MIQLEVIDPSTSAWHSPIVLALNTPNEIISFCINFSEVNKIVSFNAYPMPRVDILLSQLGEAVHILTKGYWQIPLSPQDKEKAAFMTPPPPAFITLPKCLLVYKGKRLPSNA